MPKISCIMTTYNSEKYLEMAIESILNQTFDDFEFIISEWWSTDNTKEIIKKYAKKDKRIIFIDNEKNLSNCECLNQCLEKTTGEYITIMESDDFSVLNRFELCYKALSKNDNVDVLYHNYKPFYKNEDVNSFKNQNTINLYKKNVKEYDGLCWYVGSTVSSFFNKKLINSIGNFEFKYVWDINYSAKVYLSGVSYMNTDTVLYLKRENESSLYYRKIFRVRKDRYNSTKFLIKKYKVNSLYTKFVICIKLYGDLFCKFLYVFKNLFLHK